MSFTVLLFKLCICVYRITLRPINNNCELRKGEQVRLMSYNWLKQSWILSLITSDVDMITFASYSCTHLSACCIPIYHVAIDQTNPYSIIMCYNIRLYPYIQIIAKYFHVTTYHIQDCTIEYYQNYWRHSFL